MRTPPRGETLLALLPLLALTASITHAQPPAATKPPADSKAEGTNWAAKETFLTGLVQLTLPEDFTRAGEAYFDHETPPRQIIFQAIPRPAQGQAPDANYTMFVATLTRSASGAITGIEKPVAISAPGSYNTCGWFHPAKPGVVVWGSTIKPPTLTDAPGYSKDRQRYSWQFPPETDVVQRPLNETAPATPLFTRPGYDAEGSFSNDGRFYLYTHVDPANNDPNLWIYDTLTKKHTPIVTARGYDGGPFFHPDFPKTPLIVYRSDRKGDNNLQLFVGEIAFGDDGDASVPIGLAREIQLTDDKEIVNWCPYWHPSGKYLVFASSAAGHQNYEVYAIEWDASQPAKTTPARRARITHAPGFDGLPVFSADGKTMMWTSQRGPNLADEQRPSSQLWIGTVTGEPAWEAWPREAKLEGAGKDPAAK